MPNGLKNWKYKDVINFLKERGFVFQKEKGGSHEAWVNFETEAVVEINFIVGKKSYPIRTLETMIRQSGLNKKEWRNWAS